MSGDRYTVADSPAEIWLSPQCEEQDEGRSWEASSLCDCPDCGAPAVRYIRADLIDGAIHGSLINTATLSIAAELARRNQQVAALLDVAEAAKALLDDIDKPKVGINRRYAIRDRLRNALAATADLPKAEP